MLITIKILTHVSHLMGRHLLQGKEHLVNAGFTIWNFTLSGFTTKLDYITFNSGLDTHHL